MPPESVSDKKRSWNESYTYRLSLAFVFVFKLGGKLHGADDGECEFGAELSMMI